MAPIITCLALLWVLLGPAWTSAATYYVATTGNNSNDGSESTPWLTIKKAVDTMVAGDTTYVRGGTYNVSGSIRFGVTGTASAPIKLLNYPGELPIINFTAQTDFDHVVIENNAGFANAMGWITISGFEIRNGYEGIKFYNLHDGTISHNHIHDHINQGILGSGGTRVLIQKNVVNHNGPFSTNPTSNLEHGIYIRGSHITILNNVIYDNLAYGITQNGSSSSVYSPTRNPSVEFSGANNWIIANNTIAYNRNRAGIVVWGALCDDSRYENNIFYENSVTLGTGEPQGINCSSCTGSTGLSIKNNHYYGSGSGAQVGNHASLVGTISGNVVNVSPPAFVDGGSNLLPATPDFRLTARAPVNIALANEFLTNGVVGAFQPLGDPTGTITTNKIRLTFDASTAVPINNLSTTGVTAACTLSNCPGTLTPTNVTNVPNTDTSVEIPVSGFVGDACASTNLSVTTSYNSATGSWTGNDNIGPYPGLHQKILSFTNIALVNNCTGSGPTGYPAGYHLYYKFDDGTGTNANDESANNLDGTLTNSPTWGAGKTGSGVVMAGNNTQHVAVPYTPANFSSNSLTVAFGVDIPVGAESLPRQFIGTPLGADQRWYISTKDGTWRIGIQASSDATAGNIAVTSGWHNVCLTMDSAADVATLYIDGVASTAAGAVKSYTSYVPAGAIDLGRIADVATGGGGGTYDDFLLYTSVQDCAAISAAFNAVAPPSTGTLKQEAIRFNGVILDTSHNPIVLGSLVQSIAVPKRGGVVILFQVRCTNVADCDMTAFRLVYAKNGSSTWQQVPNVETADGTWMWGLSTEDNLNNGIRSTRLTGSCTMTTGATLMTADQVPSLDLPQDGCTVLAYIVHADGVAGVDYFDYKLRTQSDLDLPGGYDEIARIKVVNPMGGGAGY